VYDGRGGDHVLIGIGAEAETERSRCEKHAGLTEQRRFFDITDRNVMVLELKTFPNANARC